MSDKGAEVVVIETELSRDLGKFSEAVAVIEAARPKLMAMTINGIEDKAGLKEVHDARILVKTKRLLVETIRKELKEDVLIRGRAIDSEAKRVTDALVPIEEHLKKQEQEIEDEKERMKAEEKARRQSIAVSRQSQLKAYDKEISVFDLIDMSDIAYSHTLDKAKREWELAEASREEERKVKAAEAEKKRLADEAEKKAREEERERLALIAKEQAEERKRLNAIAEKVKAEQKALDDKILAEKKRLEDIEAKKKDDHEAAKLKIVSPEAIAMKPIEEFFKDDGTADRVIRFVKPGYQTDLDSMETLATRLITFYLPEMSDETAKDIIYDLGLSLKKTVAEISEWIDSKNKSAVDK